MLISTIQLGSYAALWLIVIVQTIVLLEVLRQIGILRRRMPAEPGALLIGEGLLRGTPAPPFTGLELQSKVVKTFDLANGRLSLLVFLSPGCVSCQMIAPDIELFAREHTAEVSVVLVCAGGSEECGQLASKYKVRVPILLDEDMSISRAYKVQRTPSATLVDASGRVRIHGIPNTLDHLDGLLREEGTPKTDAQWTIIGGEEVPARVVR